MRNWRKQQSILASVRWYTPRYRDAASHARLRVPRRKRDAERALRDGGATQRQDQPLLSRVWPCAMCKTRPCSLWPHPPPSCPDSGRFRPRTAPGFGHPRSIKRLGGAKWSLFCTQASFSGRYVSCRRARCWRSGSAATNLMGRAQVHARGGAGSQTSSCGRLSTMGRASRRRAARCVRSASIRSWAIRPTAPL